MAVDGVTGIFREAAIPGLTDTSSPTPPPADSATNKQFPNLTAAQSAANLKAAGATAATSSNGNPITGAAGGALGKTEFLQLLVQEMTNQDPLKPADNTQFIAQLAQFSTLEQMQNLNSSFTNMQTAYQESQANSLLGQQVQAVDSSTGAQVNGKVDQVILSTTTGSDGTQQTTVKVDVSGTQINLSDITAVGARASSGSSGTSGTGSSLPGAVVPPSSGSGTSGSGSGH